MANYYYDKYNATIEINQGGTWRTLSQLIAPYPETPGTNVREILPTNPISLGPSISQNSALVETTLSNGEVYTVIDRATLILSEEVY